MTSPLTPSRLDGGSRRWLHLRVSCSSSSVEPKSFFLRSIVSWIASHSRSVSSGLRASASVRLSSSHGPPVRVTVAGSGWVGRRVQASHSLEHVNVEDHAVLRSRVERLVAEGGVEEHDRPLLSDVDKDGRGRRLSEQRQAIGAEPRRRAGRGGSEGPPGRRG
eukprot:5301147-Prymnesium_polylepis.1